MIESFSFDHTKIKRLPFVRLAKQIFINDGAALLQKYDVRFTRPNEEFLAMPVMHALEHILATELDLWCEAQGLTYVDFSPMGCQTGFYLSLLTEEPARQQALLAVPAICAALQEACAKLLDYSAVPHASARECGNYLSFDLAGAKLVCRLAEFRPFEVDEA